MSTDVDAPDDDDFSAPPNARELLEGLQHGREYCTYCFHPLRRAPNEEMDPSPDFVPDAEREYAPGRDSHLDTDRVLFCPECGREDGVGAGAGAGEHRSKRELHVAFEHLADHLADRGVDVDPAAGHECISECNADDSLAGRDFDVLARGLSAAVDFETNE